MSTGRGSNNSKSLNQYFLSHNTHPNDLYWIPGPGVLSTSYLTFSLLSAHLTIVFSVSLRLGYPRIYLIMKYYQQLDHVICFEQKFCYYGFLWIYVLHQFELRIGTHQICLNFYLLCYAALLKNFASKYAHWDWVIYSTILIHCLQIFTFIG